jgi:polysaccharide biosynthesis/export protein
MKLAWLPVLFLAAVAYCPAQQSARMEDPQGVSPDWNARIMAGAQAQANDGTRTPQDYRIGPEDLVEISVFEVPELSRTVRVSASGDISLPLIGIIQVAGFTPLQLEQAVMASLRQSYVKDPQVSVFLKEYRSDPVSVVGAVKAPGLYQIQTQKTLIELLAMAQGLSESPRMLPGRTIVITHKPGRGENEAGATGNPDDNFKGQPQWSAVEEIPLKELLESGDSKWNVAIYPGDVIKVVPAGTFYVAGDVEQPGGFPLTDFDFVSAIQALAMAGGTKNTAKLKEAVIIRRDTEGNRVEEQIDLKKLYAGKVEDVRLGSNDILFVPGSVGKAAGLRALEASIQVATGLLIWGL